MLVSTRKGLVIYAEKNGVWQYESLHFPGIPVCLSYWNPLNGTLWAFQDHGHWGIKMVRSRDIGDSWEEVAAPVYPEGAVIREDKPASLSYIWAAHHGGRDHPDRLWLGTVPGGLFMSEDNGDTWEINRALWNDPMRTTQWFGGGMSEPGIHSIVLDPDDSRHMYIAISCAGVYETNDGGTSWQVRNKGLHADFLPDPNTEVGHDPHLLAACASSLRHLWQQNHCGIFRSTDGAASWTDVSEKDGPAKFGFAVAVHEQKPDTAWVVPGISDEVRTAVDNALCVCRTEDGGKTWTPIRKGLPQEASFDIVYRHGLARSGRSMAFGTTTGNLFVSHDDGESWQTLNNYLPMVYAVDFVE